jgi:hypothetical protein
MVTLRLPNFANRAFSPEVFSTGFLSFEGELLSRVDQPVDNGFDNDRICKEFETTPGHWGSNLYQ